MPRTPVSNERLKQLANDMPVQSELASMAEELLLRRNIAPAFESVSGFEPSFEKPCDPRMAAGVQAAHPDTGRGVDALLDPKCKCGHYQSHHVKISSATNRYGVCNATPSGMRCNCRGFELKVS